jgi:hypothetical protein
MAYPVSVAITGSPSNRNRLTTAFRLILALPHLILVGGVGFGFAPRDGGSGFRLGGEAGLLGAVAVFLAIVSWFTIVVAGTHITGIRQFTLFYMRWRVRALAYLALLTDPYPPFGDAPYPASIEIVDPAARNRATVALRLILAIPHIVVLFFVLCAWFLTTVVAWFSILFTGRYPEGLYAFGVGVLRWRLRLEAYMLLLVDDYPPFSLD